MRVLSDNANERFTDAFFERRVRYALEYRRRVMGGDFNACRLVFGEADGLPGVTVDRFEDVLAAQIPVPGHGAAQGPHLPRPGLAAGGDGVEIRGRL